MVSISDFINFLTQNWIVIGLLGLIIYFGYSYLKNRKPEQYKKREIKKEVKGDEKELHSNIEIKVNQPLFYGFSKIGFVRAMVKLKQKPYVIFDNKTKKYKFIEINSNKVLWSLKVCGNNPISKFLSALGFKNKYYIIDSEYIQYNPDNVMINPNTEYSNFGGVLIFSSHAKEIVENISFKINRENELESIINWIPKMDYFNERLAFTTAQLREKAEIERAKYKSQVESAEST